MKRAVSIILVLLICFALFSGCSDHKHTSGAIVSTPVDDASSDASTETLQEPGAYKITPVTEVPDGYVGIYSVQDLLKIDANKEMNYILMSDLDLSLYSDWEGLSNNARFNGNGHTISNLSSTKSGLFKKCHDVSGLILENVEIEFDNRDQAIHFDDYYIGAIANTVNSSVTGCSATGYITIHELSEDILEDFYLGGIVGYAQNSMISSCTNNVDISYDTYDTCDRFVDITCGGIVGLMENEGNTGRISNCVNNADIYAYAYSEYDSSSLSYQGLCGGIVGEISTNINIDACVNSGNITGSVIASGIVATTTESKYLHTFNVTNCINSGIIEIAKENGRVYFDYDDGHKAAGIIGELCDNGVYLSACYNIGKICGEFEDAGSLIAHAETDKITIKKCVCVNNSDYGEQALSMDGKGGLYPNSDNNEEISLIEAKDRFSKYFKEDV